MNFYHRFIPHCATILSPLNALLKSIATNSRSLQWTTTATSAFEEIKNTLAKTTLLVHPKSDAPIIVMTDASDVAIGAVLQQYLDGKWCPLSYFSRKLSPMEQRYSTFDRELLAVYCAIRHFRHFLEAREFYVLTDHKPLTHSLKSKPDRHSPWQVRHLDFISQFTSDIRHVTGQDNPVADALSCLGANAILRYISSSANSGFSSHDLCPTRCFHFAEVTSNQQQFKILQSDHANVLGFSPLQDFIWHTTSLCTGTFL